MATRGSGRVMRLAMPIKAMVQRFALLLLLAASGSLLVLSKADTVLTERARTAVADVVVPIMATLAEPVAAANRTADTVNRLIFVYRENDRLREENARLRQWRDVAARLEPENARLRRLLQAGVETPNSFISARVVGDSGGPFVRTWLLAAGQREGVEKGQAIIGDGGLIGRVAEAGQRSARVLLLTDLNSRIPVAVEGSRARAVLLGDNSPLPRLDYLPAGAEVVVGDRIVTSGDGGLFPAGLPIGQGVAVGDGGIRVQPLVDLDRLEFVRAVQFESPRLSSGGEFGRSGARR